MGRSRMEERGVSLLGIALVAGVFVSAGLGVASCGTAFSSGAETDGGTGPKDATADSAAADGTYETGAGAEGGTDSSAADVAIAEGSGPEAGADGGSEGGKEAGEEAAAEGGLDAGAEAGSEGGAEGGACNVTGQSCIPGAPPGWTGPVQFHYGTGTPLGCPANTTSAFTGGTGLNAPPATCSACTCDGPTGESCTTTIQFYNDTSCGVAPCSNGTIGTTCSTIGAGTCDASSPSSYTASAEPTGGQCVASPQAPTVPPYSWSSNAAACAGNGAPNACGSAGVCAPPPASGFQYCIYVLGTAPCPGSPYPNLQVVYTGATSDRSCAPCTCGAPAGQCSGGTFTLGKICPGSVPMALPLSCSAVAGTSGGNAVEITPPTLDVGTCPAGGGTPTGSASQDSPISICCGP